MASGESSEPLEFQTCVLRVSIHCEGCKNKVKKVLRKIDGVLEAHIDSQLNKVTVVSNVGADTLIKKLNKAGKPAELWPEKKPTNPNPDPNTNPNPNPNSSNSNNKNKNKSKATSKSNNEPAGNPDKAKDGKANVEVPNSNETEPTQKANVEVPNSDDTEDAAPEDAKEEEATNGAAPEDGEKAGGSGSKKKGKKGKKEGAATGEEEAVTEEVTENAESPRHHQHFDEPLAYTPQPVSAYNMAHPSMSNSYYYSPAPMPAYEPQAYMYSHPPPESYYSSYPPAYPHVESYYTQPEPGPSSSSSSAPAGSYDMFSDENANSCKVM